MSKCVFAVGLPTLSHRAAESENIIPHSTSQRPENNTGWVAENVPTTEQSSYKITRKRQIKDHMS